MYYTTHWMLSQSVEVTDKWVVKWLHSLFNGWPSLVLSLDIRWF